MKQQTRHSAGKTGNENQEFEHGHFLLNAAMMAAMKRDGYYRVPRTQRSAPRFAAWCAAEPGPMWQA
jgi:hypothetical protein